MKEKKYSINDLIKVITHNIVLIIIFAVVGAVCFFAIAKHRQVTTYSAERSIMVSHNLQARNAHTMLKTDLMMIPTYEDMISSRQVMGTAYKKLPKKIRRQTTVKGLANSIKTDSKPGSLIITIKAVDQGSNTAINYVNATAVAAKDELPRMQRGTGLVYVYPKATKKNVSSQTHGSVKKWTLVGGALGIIVGMLFSFMLTTWRHIA